MNNISCDAIRHTVKTGTVLLDVRNPDEFKCGHLPNAINISLDKLPELAFEQLDKHEPILVYCLMGGRATAAESILADLGFTQVTPIGGIEHYKHCHAFIEVPLEKQSPKLKRKTTMKIEQLFDAATGTYSYLLWDEKTREAALIDSVLEQVERDTKLIKKLDLDLKYTLETHIHADHVTASGLLRKEFGCAVAAHKNSELGCADILLSDDDKLMLGDEAVYVIHTPGHTDTCISFHINGAVFTGDTLLIDGCGRTDFQSGDAKALYYSITEKLFALGGELIVYPGHDYIGLTASTIGRERATNSRLGGNKSEEEFIAIMATVVENLAPPARIDVAVPGNLECGLKAA